MRFRAGWFTLGSVCSGARLCVALWLIAFSSSAARAGDPARDFGCLRPLRVAVFEFGAWYHNGAGITPDFFKVLGEKSGCAFDLVDLPRDQAWAALGRGDIDIIPNSIRTPERDKRALFVNYLRIRNLLVAGLDAPSSLDAFIKETNGRLALVDGFFYGSYFDLRIGDLVADDRIVRVTSPDEVFALLRQGSVQAALATATSQVFYLTDTERNSRFKVVNTGAVPQPSGLAFSRAAFSPAQADNWLRLIEQMTLDQSLITLLRHHLPPRLAQAILTR